MAEPVVHDWLRPKILALLAEAESAGIARDVAVAVLIDLMTGTDFNLPVPNPEPARGRAAAGGYRDTSVTED
jgi:hypothetical protein